jgi:hypothetical protein
MSRFKFGDEDSQVTKRNGEIVEDGRPTIVSYC